MQRRFFLTATASLLMASGFLSSPVFAATRVIDTDLVIVGGGLSDIAAAAEATDKGLKPVVLEKLAILGGAGNFPEGSLGIGTRYQKEHGIKWDVQRTLNRFLEFNHYRTNPNVIRQLIAESGATIDWVVDKGVTIRGIRTIMPEEESFHCWHLFKGGASTVVAKLAESEKAKGATILMETPAKKLILTNGRFARAPHTSRLRAAERTRTRSRGNPSGCTGTAVFSTSPMPQNGESVDLGRICDEAARGGALRRDFRRGGGVPAAVRAQQTGRRDDVALRVSAAVAAQHRPHCARARARAYGKVLP